MIDDYKVKQLAMAQRMRLLNIFTEQTCRLSNQLRLIQWSNHCSTNEHEVPRCLRPQKFEALRENDLFDAGVASPSQ